MQGMSRPSRRIDLPTGGSFEPTALRQGESSFVAGSFEAYFHDEGIVSSQFEIETGHQRIIDETKLHESWLEQHASFTKKRQQFGDVFAAHVDGGVTGIAAFESGQQPQRCVIRTWLDGLPSESLRGQQRDARIRIQHRDRHGSLSNVDPVFEGSRACLFSWR